MVKEVVVRLRVSKAERDAWVKEAKAIGVSLSEVIRSHMRLEWKPSPATVKPIEIEMVWSEVNEAVEGTIPLAAAHDHQSQACDGPSSSP